MVTTMNLFSGKVCRALSQSLGDGYQVKLQDVTKNNGVKLCGVVILTDRQNVSPTIYLEPFLDSYNEGMPLTDIIARVTELYRSSVLDRSEDFSFFRSFDLVKDRICYRLINRGKNAELLEQIPHVDFLDLAVCFYYSHDSAAFGIGSVRIFNRHMAEWGCSTAQLMRLAQRNTPQLFPGQALDMQDVLQKALEDAGEELGAIELPQELRMKVLTNARKVNGAAVMLYPGMLRSVAQELDSDLYILPSSIHEVILLAAEGQEDEELRRMVRDVNETQVAPEEVLSDEVYYYDRRSDRVSMRT